MITAETVRLFVDSLREKDPNLQIRFKDESLLMRLIGMLVFPFNPHFATSYVTTIGSTIYFPSKAAYEVDPMTTFRTIAHEFVHIWDSKQDPWFKPKYLFPQSLAVIPVIAYAVLAWKAAWVLLIPVVGYFAACYIAKRYTKSAFVALLSLTLVATLFLAWVFTTWKLVAFLGLLVVAPWPARWRTYYELRGYGMSVAFGQWIFGNVTPDYMKFVGDNFSGPSYYYMCRDRSYVDRSIEATRQQAEAGALQKVFPYSHVHDFLYRQGLLHRPT
jgi:hypothetical protein